MTTQQQSLVPQAPQRQAVAKRDDLQTLTVQFPAEKYNVLAPKVHMPEGLPAGTRLVATEVSVNTAKDAREVFPLAGGLLLVGKTGLDRIANAAGITWVDETRKDDRRHPHYVEAFVKGRITDFDGTVREITGTKTIDLREDAGGGIPGKDYDEIVSKAREAVDYQTKKPKPRDPTKQLREARKFISEIAFSKAKNRAIASAVALKRGYTQQELRKPFIVPKLALDTSNPEARQLAQAAAAGATAMLYGARAQAQSTVVDAEFEEPEQPPPSTAGGEAAGEVVTPAANTAPAGGNGGDGGDEPPHDPATGETVDSILRGAWSKAKTAGKSSEWFKQICNSNTGKTKAAEMTIEDARQVAIAVEGFLSNRDDDMPV